ncbi:MAG TPA: hypothetical protein PKC76_13100, partial [Saprospiraceae bacterium]|nr:hypothetical protein [Saprospiraceae bacterium]
TLQPTEIQAGKLPLEIACMLIGCITVYAALFSTGFWIYNNTSAAWWATGVAVAGSVVLFRLWQQIRLS